MPSHRNSRSRRQSVKRGAEPIPGHRPVGARALKSTFDTLRPWLAESRVLDLYAGSGRFGLTALKEGAQEVVLVEKVSSLAKNLRASVPTEAAEKVKIIQEDALSYLEQAAHANKRFDIIFLDPPFEIWNETFGTELARRLEPLAAEQAILLVKYPARVVAFLRFQRLTPWKTVTFGESELQYFRSE